LEKLRFNRLQTSSLLPKALKEQWETQKLAYDIRRNILMEEEEELGEEEEWGEDEGLEEEEW